jgi:hypothetical protein
MRSTCFISPFFGPISASPNGVKHSRSNGQSMPSAAATTHSRLRATHHEYSPGLLYAPRSLTNTAAIMLVADLAYPVLVLSTPTAYVPTTAR